MILSTDSAGLNLSALDATLLLRQPSLTLSSGLALVHVSALDATVIIKSVDLEPTRMMVRMPRKQANAQLEQMSLRARLVRKQYRTGEK